IMMLTLIGQRILTYGRLGRSRDGAPLLITALVAVVVGSIGVFFGRLIKAGVSRQREYLADASAVQFTRQTHGLAGALKKIGGLVEGSQLADRGNAEEVSHMLFGEGLAFSRLFATHPPLVERIRALEPTFAAGQLKQLPQRCAVAPPTGLQEALQLGLVGLDDAGLPAPGAQMNVPPPMVSAKVGDPAEDDYRRADAIVAQVPAPLRELAGKRGQVMPLLLGLLLDDDAALARD